MVACKYIFSIVQRPEKKSINFLLIFCNRLEKIKQLGFDIVPYLIYDSKNIDHRISLLKNTAQEKGYPIDGLVMTYNDISYGESLGMTGHHPKHSIAYKFYDDIYPTRLLDVEWTIGKTGTLTPTAVFEPIEIEGSTVKRASLHNISIMKKILKIPFKGQYIEVCKHNMIIPGVVKAKDEKGEWII